MSYKLRREVADGKVESVSLGMPEVDAYLKFLRYRCRLNTWISYGYDLQIFSPSSRASRGHLIDRAAPTGSQ